MKVKVDQEECIGCGLCAQICPVVFDMDDDKAVEKNPGQTVPGDEKDRLEESVESCPTEAILIIEE